MFGHKNRIIAGLQGDLSSMRAAYDAQSKAFRQYREAADATVSRLSRAVRAAENARDEKQDADKLARVRQEFAQKLMLQHGWDADHAVAEAAVIFPEVE